MHGRGRNEGGSVAVLKELPAQWGDRHIMGTRRHEGTTSDYERSAGVGRLTDWKT